MIAIWVAQFTHLNHCGNAARKSITGWGYSTKIKIATAILDFPSPTVPPPLFKFLRSEFFLKLQLTTVWPRKVHYDDDDDESLIACRPDGKRQLPTSAWIYLGYSIHVFTLTPDPSWEIQRWLRQDNATDQTIEVTQHITSTYYLLHNFYSPSPLLIFIQSIYLPLS